MEKEKVTLLVNGKNAFPEIIRCIEEAEASVEINMFIWRDDEIGSRMADAVLLAADRGVKVSVSVDRYGVVLETCEESGKSFFHRGLSLSERLKIVGLKRIYPENVGAGGGAEDNPRYARIMEHPNITVSADEFKADHSKYYIIDDKILFLGGINIEDKENGRDLAGRVYGDYMVKLEGREYVQAFREKLSTGRNTAEGLFFGINRKRQGRRFEMERLYLDLINGAERELHITMAYFSPLKSFTKAIVAAVERGVRVTVLIPEKANFQNASNRRTMRKLLRQSGGRIGVYFSPKMLHTKLVMNEKTVSLGSTNITKKAFAQLDELNLFLPNGETAFCAALRESVAEELRAARRVKQVREISCNCLLAFLEGFLV